MEYRYQFSEAELFAAYRLLLPDEDARELSSDSAVAIACGDVMTFSEETLILLSLVGPETNQKVEHYRAWRRQGQFADVDEEREWEKMKQELVTQLAVNQNVDNAR